MAYNVEKLNNKKILIDAGGVVAAEQENKELSIGAVDPAMDDWIYAGLSPEDGKPFWAAPQDEPSLMKWEKAKARAASLQDQFNDAGKPCRVWVPTARELVQLYQNKYQGSLRGTFEDAHYWSSTENSTNLARTQFFYNGNQHNSNKTNTYRVRCVRR